MIIFQFINTSRFFFSSPLPRRTVSCETKLYKIFTKSWLKSGFGRTFLHISLVRDFKSLHKWTTTYGQKKMVKSGLEKNTSKLYVPLQSCCCLVQKNLPRKAELAWQVSMYLWRGTWNFKIIFCRALFTVIFKPRVVISRVKSLVRL